MARVIRALAAAVAVAGCGGPHIDLDCSRLFAASATRDAIAYVRKGDVYVRAGGRETRIPAASCTPDGADFIYVSPGGAQVVLYGTRSNIEFDLWGHSGRHVSSACMIDVAHRAPGPLPEIGDRSGAYSFAAVGTHLVAWRTEVETEDMVVIDGAQVTPLEHPGGACTVAATGADSAVAVCGLHGKYAARRYRLDGTPRADGDDREITTADPGSDGGMRLTPDGKTLLVWGAGVVAVDVATGAVRTLTDRADPKITTVELDPAGSGDLLVVRQSWNPDSVEGRLVLERLGPDGRWKGRREMKSQAADVYWTEPAAVWAADSCEARRVTL